MLKLDNVLVMMDIPINQIVLKNNV